MSIARSIFVLFSALILGLLFAVPGQDLPVTAYDESESSPYEVALPHLSTLIDRQEPSPKPIRMFAIRFCGVSASTVDGNSRVVQRGIHEPVRESRAILYHELRC